MVDKVTGATRAFLGQGLGMGWGDEGEAWLRSKLQDKPYEQALKQIRQEYAQYSRENPATAMGAEFAGGMAPAVGMMFVPGAQGAATAQAQRSTMGALARLAALGGATGTVAGAGSAEEGGRLSGAVTGGVLGSIIGAGAPVALRGVKGGGAWLRERLMPSESTANQRAADLLAEAVTKRSGMTPQQMEAVIAKDRAMGVPSTIANVSPATARLTRGVAKVGSSGADKIEDVLGKQKLGARERSYQQVQKGLHPGDYYADEANLVKQLRDKAGTVYDEAYAWGDVDDPRIVEALKNPRFQEFFAKARSIADTEAQAAKLRGEDPSKYALPEIYKPTGQFTDTGAEVLELTKLPDVRTLDYIKRGIDASIESGFRGQGMSTAEASALRSLRKEFVKAIDENVPIYKAARKQYAGDMEVIDAMRAGMNDFGKLDHEQVIKMVAGMGDAEKEAFRTGVARDLYATIMRPSNEPDAARRIIGSPEMQAKLQPLFDDPAQFNLFKNALERESVLFKNASRILGGSDTAENMAIKESLSGSSSLFDALDRAATGGGFTSSLSGLALSALSKGQMTAKTADKLSEMLMAKDPAEVAAVVKFLEQHIAGQAPKAVRATAGEAGTVTGATSSIWNPPPVEGEPAGAIEGEVTSMPEPSNELEQEWLKMQQKPTGALPAQLE